jgi:hypothetical protein
MEKYLGVKMVEGENMSEFDFIRLKGMTPSNECVDQPGFKVVYEDGYVSWSPKEVFEKAYRKVKKLDVRKKELLPHQVRVQEEAYELNNKIEKLTEFIISNKIFQTLLEDEQTRLTQQLMAMQYYLTILVERIENFS